jgi:hypothetical protein
MDNQFSCAAPFTTAQAIREGSGVQKTPCSTFLDRFGTVGSVGSP